VLKDCIARGVREGEFAYVPIAEVEEGRFLRAEPRHIRFRREIIAAEVDLSEGTFLLSPALAEKLTEPVKPPEKEKKDQETGYPDTGKDTPVSREDKGDVKPTPPEPKPLGAYTLRLQADQSTLFTIFPVLQKLSQRSASLEVSVTVHAQARESYDPNWLHNEIEGALLASDVEVESP
jgi:hypothetical protein